MKFNLGRAKIWLGRFTAYTNVLNFVLINYLVFQDGLNPLFIFVGLCLVCVFMYFDITRVYPQETAYGFEKTPQLVKMERDIEWIKSRL